VFAKGQRAVGDGLRGLTQQLSSVKCVQIFQSELIDLTLQSFLLRFPSTPYSHVFIAVHTPGKRRAYCNHRLFRKGLGEMQLIAVVKIRRFLWQALQQPL